MSYLARLKERSDNAHATHQQNQQNPAVEGFAGFAGSLASDFPQPANNTSTARAIKWRLHFADREPLQVYFAPAADHGEVMGAYHDAVAAEPVPERTSARLAISQERAELLTLVAAVFGDDTDQVRQESIERSMSDPDGALVCYRAIAAERGITLALPLLPLPHITLATSIPAATGCKTCRHRKQPGQSDPGYCGGGRNDLPPAYGENHPLRRLPDDMGASCASYAKFTG